MRVRIIKTHKQYKKGDILEVSPNVAHGLLDSGIGVISKDIVERDNITKDSNGGLTRLRSNNRK